MKKAFALSVFILSCTARLWAQDATVYSPDKQTALSFRLQGGKAQYAVTYKGKTMLDNSPLGLQSNEGDFASGLKLVGKTEGNVDQQYTLDRAKVSQVHYAANKLTINLENAQQRKISIVFQVSDNNIAFRYELPNWKETLSCVIQSEATGFKFPATTTRFLAPMMGPTAGWSRTTPSYETPYTADAPLVAAKPHADGYVFPGLFHVGNSGWVLVSETGVRSLYCASQLSEGSADGTFSIKYPDPKQNNGFGSTGAAIALPGVTPWRTITVGTDLKPITETTIPFDVVEPLYAPSKPYTYGKGTWSWIVWQDPSMNYADQVKFIDLAADLKFQYILIDALWDKNIGKERMQELIKYAHSKGVDVFLWYNSNGPFNDAPMGPRNRMNASVERKAEMRWLRDQGVKGLKVDFFGGDKQETMRLYEDILTDANEYGLMIIFHGTTLPRGWERMYPNYVGSEAVVASENLIFSQNVREAEAFNATMHPFIRNTVGSMEFGGVLLNKYLVKSNTDKNKRLTTDAFQLASSVLFQNPVQMFGITPNNLTDVPSFEIDFIKQVPTTWDETRYIDGYPGKYAVIARRHGSKWYIAGINAQSAPLKLNLKLPMLSGQSVKVYADGSDKVTNAKDLTLKKTGTTEVTIQPGGGVVLVGQ
ncbi:glycoside hydrolase family 97 catalytic domain-containing protein [Mucilaginibacter sp. CSA2-8R]|uniref:glycoside hydrolase family 97 protein n=1 Tax=Mucilaginibacter sp. CSA2-8R TaxID=3141542 RepID=UPI00315C72D1